MDRLDQYYTNPQYAEQCVRQLDELYDLSKHGIVEPSAGAGAFVKPLRALGHKPTALDLDPKSHGIRRADFLQSRWWPRSDRIAVVGNPPFGFASNTAIRFFNRAAEHASVIAFILPRTFRKASIQDKLDRNFSLAYDEDVPTRSFILEGSPHDVPCCWQIWEWSERKRPIAKTPDVSNIIQYVPAHQADFGLRRVGGRAGSVLRLEDGPYSERTTYFIRAMRNDAAKLLGGIDWSRIRNSTAGVRSISKKEIATELKKVV